MWPTVFSAETPATMKRELRWIGLQSRSEHSTDRHSYSLHCTESTRLYCFQRSKQNSNMPWIFDLEDALGSKSRSEVNAAHLLDAAICTIRQVFDLQDIRTSTAVPPTPNPGSEGFKLV